MAGGLRSPVELALRGVFGLMRTLGPERASDFGGVVARVVGPLLPVSRVAMANLKAALPELSTAARARVVRKVWDNLGRTTAEMPHMATLGPTDAGPGWELVMPQPPDFSRGGVLVAGHLANWEALVALARQQGVDFGLFYRAAGNQAADRVIRGLRRDAGGPGLKQFAKGAIGARAGIAHLRRGGVLGMLMDQKTNDGIAVPFFGRPAMTAPAAAALCLRFGVPLIPTRVERLGPARLRITVGPALTIERTGDLARDTERLTLALNQLFEEWIRARPGEWLWLHRRWPKG